VNELARNRLIARDRMLMSGLVFGLLFGVFIGRRVLSPVVIVVLLAAVFAGVWFALRLTRDARIGTSHRAHYEEEEYVEA